MNKLLTIFKFSQIHFRTVFNLSHMDFLKLYKTSEGTWESDRLWNSSLLRDNFGLKVSSHGFIVGMEELKVNRLPRIIHTTIYDPTNLESRMKYTVKRVEEEKDTSTREIVGVQNHKKLSLTFLLATSEEFNGQDNYYKKQNIRQDSYHSLEILNDKTNEIDYLIKEINRLKDLFNVSVGNIIKNNLQIKISALKPFTEVDLCLLLTMISDLITTKSISLYSKAFKSSNYKISVQRIDHNIIIVNKLMEGKLTIFYLLKCKMKIPFELFIEGKIVTDEGELLCFINQRIFLKFN